jgi:hypothetical protein
VAAFAVVSGRGEGRGQAPDMVGDWQRRSVGIENVPGGRVRRR